MKYVRFALSIVCILTAVTAGKASLSLTFKSDGSVVQSSGKVVTKSFADRFKEQFSSPNPNEWHFADDKGENPPGFFGNDIFLPGTPLLRISKIQKGDDYLATLAEKNGFSDKAALQRFIIANARPEFLADLELQEDHAISYVAAGVANSKNLGPEYSEIVKNLQGVALEVAEIVQKQLAGQVQKQVAEQVEEQVAQTVGEIINDSVSQSLEEWFADLIYDAATGSSCDSSGLCYQSLEDAHAYTESMTIQ